MPSAPPIHRSPVSDQRSPATRAPTKEWDSSSMPHLESRVARTGCLPSEPRARFSTHPDPVSYAAEASGGLLSPSRWNLGGTETRHDAREATRGSMGMLDSTVPGKVSHNPEIRGRGLQASLCLPSPSTAHPHPRALCVTTRSEVTRMRSEPTQKAFRHVAAKSARPRRRTNATHQPAFPSPARGFRHRGSNTHVSTRLSRSAPANGCETLDLTESARPSPRETKGYGQHETDSLLFIQKSSHTVRIRPFKI